MPKQTIRDLDLAGKRVFVRVDFNVPLEEKDGQMVITDATRIQETLPTIKFLIEKGARIILASHLGRPKGQRDPKQSLAPVAPAPVGAPTGAPAAALPTARPGKLITTCSPAFSGWFSLMNMMCRLLNCGPVTFQWKLWVIRYSV